MEELVPSLFEMINPWIPWIALALSGASIALSFASFYVLFLQPPRLELYTSDRVGLTVEANSATNKFNLACNVVNPRSKTATLHRLEAKVRDPSGNESLFVWNQFFRYLPGGDQLKDTDPHPLSVPPKESVSKFVQFEIHPINTQFTWRAGTYEFELVGWYNRKERSDAANVPPSKFHIEITPDIAKHLKIAPPRDTGARVFPVPVREWEPNPLAASSINQEAGDV